MHPRTLTRARRHLAQRDPTLARVIEAVGPCLLHDGHHDLFPALVQSIVSQQLSVKAAATIVGRVEALLPGRHLTPDALLAVPAPALRGAGLSGRKVEYVHDLAARVRDGRLRFDTLRALDDDGVIGTLTEVRGIGRWTAEMILIFRLGRLDVLPLDDVALQRAAQRVYRLRRRPTPRRFERLTEPWKPFRSVACWYLWMALDRLPA